MIVVLLYCLVLIDVGTPQRLRLLEGFRIPHGAAALCSQSWAISIAIQ